MRENAMKKTPLTDWHAARGAQMTDFHGWSMPMQYTSVTEEHNSVRNAAGLFDLGHMGRIRLTGDARLDFVQRVTTADVIAAEPGRVLYSFLCNEKGGVIDDITIYRATDSVLLVVNAASLAAVLDWLNQHLWSGVDLEDLSESMSMVAIQGPEARGIVADETDFDPEKIPYYHFCESEIADVHCLISRTGYTGEDGYELYMNREKCESVWKRLQVRGEGRGCIPIGLGARGTLRLEAAMPLYGNELSTTITPIEAGLKRFVAFDKGDFIGRSALLEQTEAGPERRLRCIVMEERAIPRTGYKIYVGEDCVGEVTSGTFSPTMQKGIAMAYIQSEHAALDSLVEVEVRNQRRKARIVRRPFYKRA